MRRQKKTSTPEYQLTIRPHFDDRKQAYTTLFRLETTASFASFRYAISVDVHREGRTLHFKVLGLTTPSLTLPGAGRAEFSVEFEKLNGMFEIVVEGLDRVEHRAGLKVAPGKVQLRNPQPNSNVVFIAENAR
jgi:hypothetical protein